MSQESHRVLASHQAKDSLNQDILSRKPVISPHSSLDRLSLEGVTVPDIA